MLVAVLRREPCFLKVLRGGSAFGVRPRLGRCFRGYGILHSTRFSDRVFVDARAVGIPMIKHSFHDEMIEGILCWNRYNKFIAQDKLYLEEHLKLLEIVQQRFPEQSVLIGEIISRVQLTLEQFKELGDCLRIDNKRVAMSEGCMEYISFLMEVARNGKLEEIIGGLLPCYWIFQEMYCEQMKGISHLSYDHPYYEFLKCYRGTPISLSAEAMRTILDEISIQADENERQQLRERFLRVFLEALQCERKFFDSFYN